MTEDEVVKLVTDTITQLLAEGPDSAEIIKQYETRILDLERKVSILEARVETETATRPPRGQYAHRTHTWIVENDPQYVMWNVDKGFAYGLGFTDEHIEKARAALKVSPPTPKRPETTEQSTQPPWNTDSDDDIPF